MLSNSTTLADVLAKRSTFEFQYRAPRAVVSCETCQECKGTGEVDIGFTAICTFCIGRGMLFVSGRECDENKDDRPAR